MRDDLLKLAATWRSAGPGHLGITRDKMPQLPQHSGQDVGFCEHLRRKGVEVVRDHVPVGDLKATQKEVDVEKVRNMARQLKTDLTFQRKAAKPLIVSSDHHILDGHHRWAAQKLLDAKKETQVHRVDMKMPKLLELARRFPGSTTGEGSGSKVKRAQLLKWALPLEAITHDMTDALLRRAPPKLDGVTPTRMGQFLTRERGALPKANAFTQQTHLPQPLRTPEGQLSLKRPMGATTAAGEGGRGPSFLHGQFGVTPAGQTALQPGAIAKVKDVAAQGQYLLNRHGQRALHAYDKYEDVISGVAGAAGLPGFR